MIQVKITSNPYLLTNNFEYRSDAMSGWTSLDSMSNTNLLSVNCTRGSIREIGETIVETIINEFQTPNDQMVIIFIGTRTDYLELSSICKGRDISVKLFIECFDNRERARESVIHSLGQIQKYVDDNDSQRITELISGIENNDDYRSIGIAYEYISHKHDLYATQLNSINKHKNDVEDQIREITSKRQDYFRIKLKESVKKSVDEICFNCRREATSHTESQLKVCERIRQIYNEEKSRMGDCAINRISLNKRMTESKADKAMRKILIKQRETELKNTVIDRIIIESMKDIEKDILYLDSYINDYFHDRLSYIESSLIEKIDSFGNVIESVRMNTIAGTIKDINIVAFSETSDLTQYIKNQMNDLKCDQLVEGYKASLLKYYETHIQEYTEQVASETMRQAYVKADLIADIDLENDIIDGERLKSLNNERLELVLDCQKQEDILDVIDNDLENTRKLIVMP